MDSIKQKIDLLRQLKTVTKLDPVRQLKPVTELNPVRNANTPLPILNLRFPEASSPRYVSEESSPVFDLDTQSWASDGLLLVALLLILVLSILACCSCIFIKSLKKKVIPRNK
jgi:hypothetical protein